jgi:hypothetical protein
VRKTGKGRGSKPYEVFELATRLFDDAVLTADDDAHPAQVSDLGAAHDQRVDVEPAPRENPRNARQHAGLVLHETVQHVPGLGGENFCLFYLDFLLSKKPASEEGEGDTKSGVCGGRKE